MLHGTSRSEERENGVRVNGRALKILTPKATRKRFKDGGPPASNRRFAHTAGADRCFGIWNIERRPLHIDGHVQNCWRLALIKARRKHGAVMRVVHPLLSNGMPNPQNGPAQHFAAKRTGLNNRV